MSHQIEFIDGVPQIAYAGEVPWHGFGTEVSPNLSPAEILRAAGLDWEVKLVPLSARYKNTHIATDKKALVRVPNGRNIKKPTVLTETGGSWHPIQNKDGFEFFDEFVKRGELEMHTAGSLRDGKMVWALAKAKESFALFKKDQVDNYFLFANPHEYGRSALFMTTAIRVVCNNTLTAAIDGAGVYEVSTRIHHRKPFDAEEVAKLLGLARQGMKTYEEKAKLLASKSVTREVVDAYLEEVFPNYKKKRAGESRQIKIAKAAVDQQPGAEFGAGTMWQAFNAVTFTIDHLLGLDRANDEEGDAADRRIFNAWFADGARRKTFALDRAVQIAKAA